MILNITADILLKISPSCPAAVAGRLAPGLAAAMARHSIDTPLRAAHFLAQCAHESAGFTRMEENLNYSRLRLPAVFPKYYRDRALDDAHARHPEQIANHVYASRLGNGPEASGDGWKYRGRGLIQLTGRLNYARFSKATGWDAEGDPSLLVAPEGAAESAAGVWADRGVNKAADADDIVAVTKLVNGGTTGLVDRRCLTARAKAALKVGWKV
jgi:putative chitinase